MATTITPDRPGRMLGQLAAHLQANPELVKGGPMVFITDTELRVTVPADQYLTWRRHCTEVTSEAIVTDGGQSSRRAIVANVLIGDFTYTLEGVTFTRTDNGFKAIVGWGAFDIAKAV